METATKTRVFAYDGREFPDPDPTLTTEQVKQMFASFFPEVATADIKEIKDEKRPEVTIFEFVRKTGTKGDAGPWTMPEWMEKYRGVLLHPSSETVEQIVNDNSSIYVNPARALLSCSAHSQIDLLESLKEKGFLKE
jgi:PRTRC genetic system protein C